jgi:hypothetical protein
MHELFGFLTAVTLLVGFWPYVSDILKGKTKPERASWVIWAVLLAIAFFTQLAEGARWSLVMPGLDFFIVSFIFILSIKYGAGGFVRRDFIALIIAGVGLVLWAITDQPLTALLIIICIDGLAAYLTIIKTFKKPSTETLLAWIMSSASGFCTILAVNHLRFNLLVYPVFLTIADSAVIVTILLGRKYHDDGAVLSKDVPPMFDKPL